MTHDDIADAKQQIRGRVWETLQSEGAARFPGARGRIPNFKGAEAAADLLASTDAWAGTEVLKSNPDSPQLPVRARALEDGKLLFMAVPRLALDKPFIRIDPAAVEGSARKAASIKAAMAAGVPVAIQQVPHVDLVVCGSVAVNRKGARVGKGGGFSDLEFALLTEAGLVDDRTVVATTVHPLQVLEEEIPETRHDFRVDLIVTPAEVVRIPKRLRRRPSGIIRSHLTEEKIAEIPVLRALAYDRTVMRSYLIVANKTIGGEHLVEKVRECLAAGPCRFQLVVPIEPPAGHAWTEGEVVEEARKRLDAAIAKFRGLGADVDGEVGDSNPIQAVDDALLRGSYDEIILSTLPPGPSRWLKLDLPHRAASHFSIPVTHVVGESADPET
jgi:5-formyltetrahydrofolate cyclo-ligase